MPERVTVAIPTFRRPRGLARLLDALAKLDTTAAVSVLVADNDAEKHEGADLCAAIRARGYRWPLRAIVVAQRGIAQVRNALTEAALEDADMNFLAMLDDDEWPEPHWLSALLTEQAKTGAGVLQGSILFDFEDRPKDWAQAFDGMSDIRHSSGPVEMLQGAGNLLMTRAALETLPAPRFDPAFALTGGEDRDFFLRLKAAGVSFAWSDEGLAHTAVPATRTSLRWGLIRAYSIGNSDMRVFLKYGPSAAARVREFARIAGALLLSPLLFVILTFDANRRADALRRLFRAAGKVAALFGRQYNEYSVIHGD
ncbi:MAG TPA: glycosyltransferase family 2 protein [Rhizomicrobium sp.]|jgi:glycosyltransferase involved in cell wall biosynthesis|nr:glycosyltransferase family 2 protein [Rhizomicrobium sp.]